jgi:hypothetical protein
MRQTFLVIKYDRALPHGRKIVGNFETEVEANEFAENCLGDDVQVLSRKPQGFQPSVEHVHRLCGRTFGDAPLPTKVAGGLRCGDEFWAYDRRGSGPDGRAMPGDLWLWVRIYQHRVAMAQRHG